jgi:hypothetical protein
VVSVGGATASGTVVEKTRPAAGAVMDADDGVVVVAKQEPGGRPGIARPLECIVTPPCNESVSATREASAGTQRRGLGGERNT